MCWMLRAISFSTRPTWGRLKSKQTEIQSDKCCDGRSIGFCGHL